MPFGLVGGTQVSWCRLGSCVLSIAPHGTGGVAALCTLGCAASFDCIGGTVPWLGLGWPMAFDYFGGALVVLSVLSLFVSPPFCVLYVCVFFLYLFSSCAPCISGSLEPILQ